MTVKNFKKATVLLSFATLAAIMVVFVLRSSGDPQTTAKEQRDDQTSENPAFEVDPNPSPHPAPEPAESMTFNEATIMTDQLEDLQRQGRRIASQLNRKDWGSLEQRARIEKKLNENLKAQGALLEKLTRFAERALQEETRRGE